MSCGPTSGWDHDKGCAVGFGGFKGMEMSSATGPFEGMQIYMDDGTRFVAGLAATPLIQYYDGTSKSNTIQFIILVMIQFISIQIQVLKLFPRCARTRVLVLT